MNAIKTYIIWSIIPDITSARDFVSLDTRTREIWHKIWHTNYKPVQLTVVREYHSSNGIEYFISIEDQMGYLYWFTRLCCPTIGGINPIQGCIADRPGLWQGTAMIRELHVYGQLATLAPDPIEELKNWYVKKDSSEILESSLLHNDLLILDSWVDNVQHTGLGRQLMSLAEQISIKKWYYRLSVISWVWVRWYYQKLGYSLVGTYLVKKLSLS